MVPALVLCVSLTWGVTYVVLRLGMQHSPPFFFAMARTASSGLLVLLAALALRRSGPVGWRTHGLLALSGTMNYSLFYGGLNYGVTYLSAGETAILNYTYPLWMALLARVGLGETLGPHRVLGLFLGLVGVALVTVEQLAPESEPVWSAYAAVLIGALSWAAGSVFFVRHVKGVALEWAVGLQNLYASVPFLLPWLFAERGRLPDGSALFWLPLGFTVLLASFVAQLAFFSLLRRREAVVVGAYVFLVPVFAALSGLVFLSEPITAHTAAGGLCVLGGIILVNRSNG